MTWMNSTTSAERKHMLAPSRDLIVGIRAALLLDRLYDDEGFPPLLLAADEPRNVLVDFQLRDNRSESPVAVGSAANGRECG
jgi:hypothetical protein